MRPAVVLVLVGLVLAGCGEVGPLELPAEETEPAEPAS